jgi:hypothetical protein
MTKLLLFKWNWLLLSITILKKIFTIIFLCEKKISHDVVYEFKLIYLFVLWFFLIFLWAQINFNIYSLFLSKYLTKQLHNHKYIFRMEYLAPYIWRIHSKPWTVCIKCLYFICIVHPTLIYLSNNITVLH